MPLDDCDVMNIPQVYKHSKKNDFELWKRDLMFDIYSIKRFLSNLEKKIQSYDKWE